MLSQKDFEDLITAAAVLGVLVMIYLLMYAVIG